MEYVEFDCKRTVPLQSFLALSHSPSHDEALALTSPPPTFCSLPSIKSHHPTKPHQIKQPLSKIAVNEIAVEIWQKNVGWALCISHFFIFLQSTSNRH